MFFDGFWCGWEVIFGVFVRSIRVFSMFEELRFFMHFDVNFESFWTLLGAILAQKLDAFSMLFFRTIFDVLRKHFGLPKGSKIEPKSTPKPSKI